MVREDIFGGLVLAIEKGETLQQAMMSFYGAGYSKKDIEEAAQILLNEQVQEQPEQQLPVKTSPEIPKPSIPIKSGIPSPPGNTIQTISNYEGSPQPIKPPQPVSGYGEEKTKKSFFKK